MTDDPRPDFRLTTGQVARRLGWCEETLRRRCASGDIRAIRLAEGGEWRISAKWLEEVLAGLEEIRTRS